MKPTFTFFLRSRAFVLLLLLSASQLSLAQINFTRSTFTAPYTAISVAGGATSLIGTGIDDGTASIPLPFSFSYNGTTFTTSNFLAACSNGFAFFSTSSVTTPTTFSNSLHTNSVAFNQLCPWWDDLNTGTGGVIWQTQGIAPNRTLTVQWTNILNINGGARNINFQLILYETTNVIEFRYGALGAGTSSTSESAQIGIKNATGGENNFIDAVTGSKFFSNGMMSTNTWPVRHFRFTPGNPAAIASGTYTVGNGQTYPSLSEAIADINHRGTTGPVTLSLTDANNDETVANGGNLYPILIGTNSNGITIQPASGNVNIKSPGSFGTGSCFRVIGTTATTLFGSAQEPVIGLVGSDNVTIRNVSLGLSGTGNELKLDKGFAYVNASTADGATNNVFRDFTISLSRTNASAIGIESRVPYTPASAAGANSGNQILNFSIKNVYEGIALNGATAFPDQNAIIGTSTACTTTYNIIGDPAVPNDIGNTSSTTAVFGINASVQSAIKIFNTRITNLTATSTGTLDGIILSHTGSSTYSTGTMEVYNNIISALNATNTGAGVVTGIRVNTTTNSGSISRVYNNLVYNLNSASTTTSPRRVIGISSQASLTGATSVQHFDHNTVFLNPASLTASNACFESFTNTTGPVINVRSNIFANFTAAQSSTSKHYAIVASGATSFGNVGSTSNFNDLYVANATNGFVGLGATTDYATLVNWNTVLAGGAGGANLDLTSLSTDPLFVNSTTGDFHVISAALSGSGSGLDSWNLNDLDCQARASFTPNDIGAFAFTPPPLDVSAFSLVRPSATSCHSAAENVIVRIRNLAGSTLDFSANPVTVSVTAGGAGSGTVSTVVSTGTLAPGAFLDVTVGTLSTASSGVYTFASSVSMTGDAVSANDSRNDNMTINQFTVSTTGPASGAICLNGSTTLTAVPANASNPVSYLWTPAAGLSSTTTASVTANPTATTTYTVTATDNCLNTSSATFALTVNPLPPLAVTPSTALICGTENGLRDPASVTLVATGANTYAWSPSTGLSATTGSTVTAIPTVTTTYSVTGTITATGCVKSVAAVVTVGPKVRLVATATPADICAGDSSQLNVSAFSTITTYAVSSIPFAPVTPTGTPTVLQNAGVAVTPLGSGTLDDGTWNNISLPSGFNFSFFGQTVTALSVSTNGFISFDPANITNGCCSGQVLPNTALPNSVIAFGWEDWNHTAGTMDYFTNGTAPNRQFVVRAQNVPRFGGISGNSTVMVILNETTNTIEMHVTSMVTASGDNTTMGIENAAGTTAIIVSGRNSNSPWTATNEGWIFTPTLSGPAISPVPPFTWTPSTNLNSTTIPNPKATNVNATVLYTVTTVTPEGCPGSTTVQLRSGTLVANISSDDSVSCAGQNVTLTANVTNGAGPYTYLWSPGGATTASIQVAPTSNTTYSVVVNGPCPAGGATTSASFTQTVEPVPVLNLNTGYSTQCFGSPASITLTASGDGTAYAWNPSTGLDATTGATVHSSGLTNSIIYTVVSTLGNCTSAKTSTVKVPGPLYTFATAFPDAVCLNGVSLLTANARTTAAYASSSETPSPVPTPGSGVTTKNNTTPVTSGTFNDGYWAVPLPFRFGLYDEGFNTVFINTNGYVNFTGQASVSAPTAIPSASSPNASVFLAWKDWTLASSGSIQYFTTGTAPNRIFVIKYVGVPPVTGTGTLNGQIELYENGDIVLFLASSDASSVKSLGIESVTGSSFLSFSSRNGVAWTVASPEMWKFAAQGGSLMYSWSPSSDIFDPSAASTPTNPLSTLPETFSVVVTDTSGCTNTSSDTVIEGVGMVVNILPSPNDTVCAGDAITLTAQVLGGGPPYTFTWDDGTNIIAGPGSQSTITVTPALGASAYNVTVTDQCNPSPGFGDIAVFVNPVPTLSVTPLPPGIPSGAVACGSDSATLIASGSSNTYAWAPSSGLSGTTGNAVKALPAATTSYTVTGTNVFGCSSKMIVPVVKSFAVAAIATATPASICNGASSQLNATAALVGAITYNMTSIPFASLAPVSPTTLSFSSNDDGEAIVSMPFSFNYFGNTYSSLHVGTNGYISFTDGATSLSSQTLPSTLTPNNVIALSMADLNVLTGSSITTFTTGIAPNRVFVISYNQVRWFSGSAGDVTGQIQLYEGTNYIEIHAQTINHGTSTATNVMGIENSTGTAGLVPPGRQNTSAWNISAPEAWRFSLPSANLFSWTPATFLNNPSIFNPLASGVTSTQIYTVTATSSDGCKASASASVTVAPLTLDSVRALSSTVCQDSSVTLTAYVHGGGTPYSYAWRDNGNLLAATGATISVTPLASGAHTYTVDVTDFCGSPAQSGSILISITPRPNVNATASGVICGNGSVTLTATGANTYVWSPSSFLSATTGAVVTANPTETTIYNVVGTSTSTGCAASASVTVNVYLLPTVFATAAPNPILLNANTQLNAIANQPVNSGYTISSIPFAPVAPSGPTTVLQNNGVAVTALGSGSLDDGTWNNISLPAGFNFNFFGQAKTSLSVSTNGFISFDPANTSNGCCSGQVLPSTTAPNDVIALAWEDWNHTSGTVDYYTTGSAPNRKFVVRMQNIPRFGGTGAPTTGMIVLNETSSTIEIHLTSVTSGASDLTTLGIENSTGTVGFAVTGRNSTAWSATNEGWLFSPILPAAPVWQYSWSPSTYLDNPTIANPFASMVGGVITYTVNLTNLTTGCAAVPATIQVLAGVALSVVAISANTTLCIGQSTLLQGIVNGGGVPYQYSWSDGTNVVGITPNITVSPSVTTAYTLTVTDVGNNTLSSAPLTVVVNPLPLVNVTPAGGSICNNVPASGIAMTATGANTYVWTPATGLSSTTAASVTANPTVTTVYQVTGTNTTTGCVKTSSPVTVHRALLAATATASPYNVCYGENSVLKTVASNALANYTVASIPNAPLTSGSPTTLSFSNVDDGEAIAIMPFSFNYFGNSFSSMHVGTNGFISFDQTATSLSGQTLPSTTTPNNVIALCWADLHLRSGSITTFTVGSAPNRVFVVSYNGIGWFSGTTGNVTGQIQLYETTGIIEIHVTTINHGTSTALNSLGIENSTGQLGTSPAGRNLGIAWNVSTPEAWRFTPPGGLNYEWSPGAFLNNKFISDPVATGITSSTLYSVTVTDPVSGCTLSDTANVVVIPLPTVTLTGPSLDCEGAPMNLNFAFTGTPPFTYSYSDGVSTFGPFTSASSSAVVTVIPPGVAGENFTYTPVSVLDARCNGSAASLIGSVPVSIKALSSLAGVTLTSNKPFNNICTGDNITLALNGITPSTLGYQAQWKWYSASCGGTPVATGVTSITVSPTVTTTYYARAEGYCNTTACLSLQVIVSTGPPSGNPSFSYTPTVAYAGSQDSIVVTPVPGATWYRWTTNGNTSILIDGHPTPWQSTSNKVIVTFVGPSTQGNGIGNYHLSMFAGNACGRTNQSNLQIRATVSQPAQIFGPNVACVGQTRTYSITPLVGAKSYVWSFSSGNGTIVGNGTTTVNVTFTALPAILCVHGVTANNSAGPDQCITITTNIANPGPVTGNITPCQGTTQPYTIAPVVGAVSYIWSTTVAGASAAGTTTTGTVSFPVGNFSGNVCVVANSGCGLSGSSCLAIVNGAPAPVGTISGPTTGLCGVTSVNYQIPATGDTIYNWGVPAGASIVSGQGTNSILVNFASGFAGGNITVQASNACGTVSGSLAVSGAPSAPSIAGSTSVCANDVENYVAFSPGATSYNWTVNPAEGNIIPTANPDEILVEWITNGGTVSASASNSCGTSPVTSLVVGSSCRVAGNGDMADMLQASVFPNPSKGLLTLQYNSPDKATYVIKVNDLAGRLILSESLSGDKGLNRHAVDLSKLAKGMYKLSMESEDGQSIVMKVVIE